MHDESVGAKLMSRFVIKVRGTRVVIPMTGMSVHVARCVRKGLQDGGYETAVERIQEVEDVPV